MRLIKYGIEFSGEAATDGFRRCLPGLVDYTLEGEWMNDGFPSQCVLLDTDDDGIVICEHDGSGGAITNATWHIGWDEIVSVNVP